MIETTQGPKVVWIRITWEHTLLWNSCCKRVGQIDEFTALTQEA